MASSSSTPPPGDEHVIARHRISFASGAARHVKGMRWFRDPNGRDIQADLPGWPPGPVFERRDKPGAKDVVAAVATLGVIAAVGGAVTGALGGGGTITSPPQDRALEVEDFPVLFGPVGSIASTLPWQLDPGRWHHAQPSAKEPVIYCHGIVTDRRFVITEIPDGDLERERVLWEIDKAHIAAAGQCLYSEHAQDFKVVFTDGSWARFATQKSGTGSKHLAIALSKPLIPADQVPPEIHQALADQVRAQNGVGEPQWTGEAHFHALPSGFYGVMAIGPTPVSADRGRWCYPMIVDEHGARVVYGEDDFTIT